MKSFGKKGKVTQRLKEFINKVRKTKENSVLGLMDKVPIEIYKGTD